MRQLGGRGVAARATGDGPVHPPAARETGLATPNDFNSLTRLCDRLLRFQVYYEEVAQPFQWKFTRRDLERLMAKLSDGEGSARWAA